MITFTGTSGVGISSPSTTNLPVFGIVNIFLPSLSSDLYLDKSASYFTLESISNLIDSPLKSSTSFGVHLTISLSLSISSLPSLVMSLPFESKTLALLASKTSSKSSVT